MANYAPEHFRRLDINAHRSVHNPRNKPAGRTSEQVADDIARFLADGGEIEAVEPGVSGIKDGKRPMVINVKNHPGAR